MPGEKTRQPWDRISTGVAPTAPAGSRPLAQRMERRAQAHMMSAGTARAYPRLVWRSPGPRTHRRAPVKSRCASRRMRVPSCGGYLGVYSRLPHSHEHGPSGAGEPPGPMQACRGWSWAPCLSRAGAVGVVAPSGPHRPGAQAVPPPWPLDEQSV